MSARLDRPWQGGTSPYAGLATRRALHLGLRDGETFPPVVEPDDGGFMAPLFWRGLAVFAVLVALCVVFGVELAP